MVILLLAFAIVTDYSSVLLGTIWKYMDIDLCFMKLAGRFSAKVRLFSVRIALSEFAKISTTFGHRLSLSPGEEPALLNGRRVSRLCDIAGPITSSRRLGVHSSCNKLASWALNFILDPLHNLEPLITTPVAEREAKSRLTL